MVLMSKKRKIIIAIADQVRSDHTIYTEEAIREAAKMHENLSVEETEQGLALICEDLIPDKDELP